MKKIICLLLAAFLFIISGCSFIPSSENTASSKPVTNILADKGLALIGKVDKLAECEEYTTLYTADADITKVIKGIADNDYTNPEGIFMIENLDTIVFENMIPDAKLPEDILKITKDKFAAALPAQISAMEGATILAATSVLSYSESFIYKNLQSSVTCLYTYVNGYNFMVTYNSNDENIVNASVAVVINDELSKCTTKEEVVSFFKDALHYEDVSVTKVIEEK